MSVRSRPLGSLAACLTVLVMTTGVQPAAALPEGQKKHHALSLVGEPKLPAEYKHFDWVDPHALKGGTVRLEVIGTFDNLNPFTIKGQAASGLGDVFDSLMEDSPDEPSTQYALVAEWVSHPDDFSSVTFKIRDGARFHDGRPVTVEDVIFSMEAVKAADDRRRFYYKNVVSFGWQYIWQQRCL